MHTSSTNLRSIGELDRFVQLGYRNLIVDRTRPTYISSYGLGLLVRLHKILALPGGDVKLAAIAGGIP